MLEFMNFQVDVLENLLYRGLGWEGWKGELKKLLLLFWVLRNVRIVLLVLY